MLNRIAVTNLSTDKRTPNTQVAQHPATPDIIEHSQSRYRGDGAPYDGNPHKNQDISRELRRLTTFTPRLGV
jgi:hypothetical protein